MPVVPKFRYIGVVFDVTSMARTLALHSAEMLQTTKLFAIYGSGVLLLLLLILYKGLIRFVLEYGCIAFDQVHHNTVKKYSTKMRVHRKAKNSVIKTRLQLLT
jgi:hypothetical protein